MGYRNVELAWRVMKGWRKAGELRPGRSCGVGRGMEVDSDRPSHPQGTRASAVTKWFSEAAHMGYLWVGNKPQVLTSK